MKKINKKKHTKWRKKQENQKHEKNSKKVNREPQRSHSARLLVFHGVGPCKKRTKMKKKKKTFKTNLTKNWQKLGRQNERQ